MTTYYKVSIYKNIYSNNKAFKSQTSRGRLELKPNRSNQGSGTWITVLQALLSKSKSLGIFYPFKSHFIASTQVNFGLPLPLFTLLSWLRIPLSLLKYPPINFSACCDSGICSCWRCWKECWFGSKWSYCSIGSFAWRFSDNRVKEDFFVWPTKPLVAPYFQSSF